MRRHFAGALFATGTVAILILGLGLPAMADHTNPKEPLSNTTGPPAEGIPLGEGEWTYIKGFPPNPGTDLRFFKKGPVTYASSGTLGQADEEHVGQRILRLVNRHGIVRPKWLADHGSANCPTANPGGTLGLQHDVQVTPKSRPQLIVDATDATGRCHDPGGGGIELVDIWKIRKKKFEPRETHLVRFDGTAHNQTVDATRPWIVYISTSDTLRPWIDVVDIRSCLGHQEASLAKKRERCRPKVYRLPFDPRWTTQINYDPNDGEVGKMEDPNHSSGGGGGCHDITAVPGRIYCAALNGTVYFDVSNLTTPEGRIKGERLPCKVIDGTLTKAKVTNCDLFVKGQGNDGNDPATEDLEAWNKLGKPRAKGWRHLGHINHPGREDLNGNQYVEADEGVALSHQSDPSPDGKWLWVTDERGGGVQPPGASCTPGLENPIGNGGLHVFDIRNPFNPKYAKTPDGAKAIFISDDVTPAPTFCNIHVIRKVPGEQRLLVAWYSQGIKIVDYFIENGKWSFDEVASYRLPNANTWTVEDFKIKEHKNGERTYFLMTSDIQRGIDIVKWRGPTNKKGERGDTVMGREARATSRGNTGLLVTALTVLPAAAILGRRRRALIS
ncbi:MAG: hypothetical protein M3280_06770 [Actinomycetota bacterium]|nr:hypothetical protein [Actinomycetota bacterium]